MKDFEYIFLSTGETATAVLTFSQTEGDSEKSTTSSKADTDAQPLWLVVRGPKEARPQPCFFVGKRLLVRAFSGMIAADVLSEVSVEEAIGITTVGKTSNLQPLR